MTFGVLAAVAFMLVAALQQKWLAWALPAEATGAGPEESFAHAESLTAVGKPVRLL